MYFDPSGCVNRTWGGAGVAGIACIVFSKLMGEQGLLT